MFCEAPGCSRGRPYRIPGCLARHLRECHAEICNSIETSRSLADLSFAKEVARRQREVALPELEDGEIPSWEEEEEEEECMLSGQVMRPSEFSLLDLLHPALPGQQQLQVFAIHGVGQPPPPPRPLQPPPRPRQQAVVPGISVTVLIYDLETTG